MPSLNLDLDYLTNPKVTRLVALLGPEGFIIPIRLWLYVGKHYTVTGILLEHSEEEIERIVGWCGQPSACVAALVKLKFLHKSAKGYAVHDWKEHAGHLVAYKKRAKSAASARWNRFASSNASSKTKPMTKQCSDISSLSISSHSDPEQGKEEEKSKTSEPSASPTSFSASNGNGHRNGHKHGHKTEPIIPTPDELKLVETLRGRWNEIPGVVLCPSLDGTLLRRVTQLVREKPERWWMIFFEQVSNSNFLRGGVRSREDKRPMRVDLAWAMNPDHLGDIMSGRYDQAYDRQPRQLTGRSPM